MIECKPTTKDADDKFFKIKSERNVMGFLKRTKFTGIPNEEDVFFNCFMVIAECMSKRTVGSGKISEITRKL